MQFYVQDPSEKIEYQMNWTDGIPEVATIATSTWTSTPFTASGTSIDGLFTVVSLIGGVVGKRYKVENTITLSNGQTYTDSIFIYIEDK
mgnify:CR=1 FL=1